MEKLPEWDLSDLYLSIDDPKIEDDLQKLTDLSKKFSDKYKGKISELKSSELLGAVKEYDDIHSIESKLGIYAHLMFAKNQNTHLSFEKKMSQRLTDIGTQTMFFNLELAKCPISDLENKIISEQGLEFYRVFLEQVVKQQPYQLGEDVEIALSKKNLTGREAWIKFFDKLESTMKFDYNGKKLALEEILTLRADPERSVREEATKSFYKGLQENAWIFTYITNTLSQDNTTSNDMRRYPTAVTFRNMSNNISDEVVNVMNKAINEAYPRVSHRYYEVIRKMLGLEKLKGWDRNAPLGDVKGDSVPYENAKDIVLKSYRSFSPKMADIAEKFFDNNWIDAPVTEGKASGAFSMPAPIGANPYVLLNYLGKRKDIATMAHELGHGIHQYVAEKHLKSQLMADTPLTVAETASIFGERLTFERMLECEGDPQVRINLLAGKVNDMINTVVRQNTFFNFEKELHETRKVKGEDLEPKEINSIYMKTQKEALGPAFDLDEDYGMEWAYVSHFVHTPYYVYSYAFGECLVNSLYNKYQESENKQEFADKYIEMLELGGSKNPNDMVKSFGLDLEDPNFWAGGMKAIEQLIDKLEKELAL